MVQTLKNSLSRIIKGYGKLASAVFKALFILAAAAGINVILIYPLWYSAIHFKKAYTAVTGTIALILILFLSGKSIAKRAAAEKSKGNSPLKFFLKPVLKAGKLLIFLAFLYLFTILFFTGYRAAALFGIILFLFVTGLMFFPKKGS